MSISQTYLFQRKIKLHSFYLPCCVKLLFWYYTTLCVLWGACILHVLLRFVECVKVIFRQVNPNGLVSIQGQTYTKRTLDSITQIRQLDFLMNILCCLPEFKV
jgi:hypothetical protein